MTEAVCLRRRRAATRTPGYITLIRECDQYPVLNSVWLTLDEKRCYRYVRAAIEIFEQTFQLHQKGWIDDETWVKWKGWISLGPEMRYFRYVFEDTEPRLTASSTAEFARMSPSHPATDGT